MRTPNPICGIHVRAWLVLMVHSSQYKHTCVMQKSRATIKTRVDEGKGEIQRDVEGILALSIRTSRKKYEAFGGKSGSTKPCELDGGASHWVFGTSNGESKMSEVADDPEAHLEVH